MKSCTFFGHRNCPDHIQSALRRVLTDLITTHGVNIFYVGNQGQFDALVRRVLRDLQQLFPHIQYAVVLAYMPAKPEPFNEMETLLPEGIESIHPRYAISWRSSWMLQKADFVVTYITHSWGGAAQYAAQAKKQNKQVFNIAEASCNRF